MPSDPYSLELHSFFVTFFSDKFADQQHIDTLSLGQIAELIRTTHRPDKADLPWLKLAQFGNQKTDKGSLRSNANMRALTGVEAEHDAGTMTFDAAVAALRAAQIRCLVYATPSYVEGVKERWRVLAPLSNTMPTTERAALVARLNGVLGGCLAPESFTLSQAYLYGNCAKLEVLDGYFVDCADDLAAGAIGKRRVGPKAGAVKSSAALGETAGYSDADLARMLEQAMIPGKWHNTLLSVTSALAGRRMTVREICEYCASSAIGGADDPELIALAKTAVDKYGIGIDRETQHKLAKGLINLKAAVATAPADSMFERVELDDFEAFLPKHLYVFMPTRDLWVPASVDGRIDPIPRRKADGTAILNAKGKPTYQKATAWLDKNRPLQQMTWMPGEPAIIEDRLMADGGWIDRKGSRLLNLYQPPVIELGDANQAGRWIEHLETVYPDDSGHIIKWLAHRVQKPGEKINHALVLGGAPGIGKDTILEPVKYAVGHKNMTEIAPKDMLGRFNGYGKSVILRISEARDLGDMSRYEFYERTKTYAAAPPDVLRIDEKNRIEYAVPNVCGLVITTNYFTDGIYLPADDRRHYVAWNRTHKKEDFTKAYFDDLWAWYEGGGYGHVAAYLHTLDIRDFRPKATPPLTEAFHAIVNANMAPEDGELADVLDRLGNPDAVTIAQVQDKANAGGFKEWLEDRRSRRAIPHRFEQCGYVAVRARDSKQGLWRIHGKREVVYAKLALTVREQYGAVSEMIRRVEEARAAALREITERKTPKKGK